jgi:hypothetical protein
MSARDATVQLIRARLKGAFPPGFRAKVSFVVENGDVPPERFVLELKPKMD